jgi:hypothetical protein
MYGKSASPLIKTGPVTADPLNQRFSGGFRSTAASKGSMVGNRADSLQFTVLLDVVVSLPRQALSFTVGNRTCDHGQPLASQAHRLRCDSSSAAVSGSAPKIDSTILKATARACRWLNDSLSGRVASMAEIGQREGVGTRYVSRMIRLAFLAPTIIERIVEGRQPPELTAQFPSTSGDLPLSWRAQEQLGFTAPAWIASLVGKYFLDFFVLPVPGQSHRRISAPRTSRDEIVNLRLSGGGGGIRTHERLSSLPIFKTGAFNHSATPPRQYLFFSRRRGFQAIPEMFGD